MKARHLLALALALCAVVSTRSQAQLVSGDSVSAVYSGIFPNSTPPGSTGIVGGSILQTSFTDGFGQNWLALSAFVGSEFLVEFESTSSVNANISNALPGLTIDYTFGSSNLTGTSLASFTSGSLFGGLLTHGDSLVSMASSGPHNLDLSFNSLYNGDVYQFNAGAAPEPESWALMLAGVCAVGVIARRRRSVA